ncbi:TPA: HlyD family efflux transporter periplasmic adaptor subunit [Candidatus Poribacteria bacterium]|nr:HlyD family efflux transporter periplasmic adaptor subunit [Candidatus Poribacteria bacterium]
MGIKGWGKKATIGAILLLMIAAGAVYFFKFRHGSSGKDDIRVERVRRGRFVVKIMDTGNLEPLISVEVKSNVEGEIKRIYVKEGDYVRKGQILMKIDDRQILEQKRQAEADVNAAKAQLERAKRNTELAIVRYQSQLKQYQAALESAKAAYEAAKTTSAQLIAQAEAEVKATENALEQDRIQLRQAQIALEQAKITLKQYESALKSAQVNLENARAEYERMQKLFNKKFVSKKEVEDAQLRYANAQTQYENALKNVETQKKVIQSQEETIQARRKAIENRQATLQYQKENLEKLKEARAAQEKQALLEVQTAQERLDHLREAAKAEEKINRLAETTAQAALLRAQSYLKNQEERLAWTTITAPMSGIVTQLNVEEGEIVISGRSAFASIPPIMTIADLSKMVVKVYVNEVDIGKIKIGQPAEIRVSTFPDKVYRGMVSEVAPSGQFRDNLIKFEVVVEVLGSPSELRPGMTADVDIIVDDRDDVLQLPIEAVLDKDIMIVRPSLKKEDLRKFKVGDKVEVETLMGKRYPGKVNGIYPDKKEENMEIFIDETEVGLQTGSYNLHIITKDGQKIEHLFASVRSERKHYVMRKSPEEEAKLSKEIKEKQKRGEELMGIETYVKIGERSQTSVEILDGLKEGDEVYVPSISTLAKVRELKEKRRREKEKKEGKG